MSFEIYSGRIDLTEPDGQRFDYERFILTVNPDGTRTLRTLTRSPKGDLLRDVNQLVAADWRPIEALGRLFYQNKAYGTVLRRVAGDKLQSMIWPQSGEIDTAEFDAPPGMTVGFHPIFHDIWKMSYLDTSHKEWQSILIHTVSNTWNGSTLGHGQQIKGQARFDGAERVTTPAGTFECQRFVWKTSHGKVIHLWRTGPHHLFVKLLVAEGDKKGSVYELSALETQKVTWPL
ncbi:MAG: hypothetical protein JNK21_13765 [Rhodospirillaceae bacterium]|nr:hypothetical protein [Rhodospirillaceae bacterium]